VRQARVFKVELEHAKDTADAFLRQLSKSAVNKSADNHTPEHKLIQLLKQDHKLHPHMQAIFFNEGSISFQSLHEAKEEALASYILCKKALEFFLSTAVSNFPSQLRDWGEAQMKILNKHFGKIYQVFAHNFGENPLSTLSLRKDKLFTSEIKHNVTRSIQSTIKREHLLVSFVSFSGLFKMKMTVDPQSIRTSVANQCREIVTTTYDVLDKKIDEFTKEAKKTFVDDIQKEMKKMGNFATEKVLEANTAAAIQRSKMLDMDGEHPRLWFQVAGNEYLSVGLSVSKKQTPSDEISKQFSVENLTDEEKSKNVITHEIENLLKNF